MDLKSLQELFANKIFRIPDYQRGYAWGERQLAEFWDDLVNLPEGREHYFGMVTLRAIDNIRDVKAWPEEHWLVDGRGYEAYYIVDGQQRLTTVSILISAIVDFVKSEKTLKANGASQRLNKQEINDIVKSYLYIPEPDEGYDTFIFGYEEDNPSYDFFKVKILGREAGERSNIEETFYTRNLENAKKYFTAKLKEIYGSEDSSDTDEDRAKKLARIEEIYRKVTQRLKVNIYEISNDFDVFVTFETMNNRGKRLSVLELLKNRLIYLSTLFPEVQDDKKIIVRRDINNAWKSIYEYLGKNKEQPLKDDEYLRDHWIMYFGYQTRQENNFENSLLKKYFSRNRIAEYANEKAEIDSNDTDTDVDIDAADLDANETVMEPKHDSLTLNEICEYVKSIKCMVKYWYATYFPEDKTVITDEDLRAILWRLNRVDYNYFRSLTAVILSKDLPVEQKIEALKSIERYIFLHFRLAGNMSSSNRSQFYKLTREFYDDRVSIDDVIDATAEVECVQGGVLRTDLVYAKTFQGLFEKYDGYYSWGNNKANLRYFLFEYETYLKDKNHATMKVDPAEFFKADKKDKVSIEHIYPQTPQGKWADWFDGYKDEEKRRFNGTLGNLLALSQSVNSSLQNDDFSEKRERYLENSQSALNVAMQRNAEGEIVAREKWGAEQIRERGIRMLDFMAEHWGFTFRNEYDKLKMLGLAFMKKDEAEEPWDNFEVEHKLAHRGSGDNRRKITPEVVQEAYAKAKEVHEGRITREEALDYLDKIGNRNSMNMHIYAFEAMLAGKNYTMDINPYALDYFVENLLRDYGEGVRGNIIATLQERVRRYKGDRAHMKEEEVLERLSNS